MPFLQLGVLLGNFKYSNVYVFTCRPLPFKYIRTVVFSKLDVSCPYICFRSSSLSILKMPYLLHEDLMVLLAPTNQPRNKCEKIQLNN